MERNLFKFIWHHSKGEQLRILALVLISLPFYYISLDLPKQIVNQGIQGEGFETPQSETLYYRVDLPLSETLTGDKIVIFEGLRIDQLEALLSLSFVFLGLVIVNGLFKFIINTRKGQMGERMLRRLRYILSDRLLRFPVRTLRRVKQAEAASMIKDEVEPLGGFIGEAFINPVFLGGQALTAMGFIITQSVWLGLVALAIIVVQMALIPKLRVPILRLGRERQITSRWLAGRIGEVVAGGVEIHAHDTSNYERADLVDRMGTIYAIRYEIFRRKFFVKFLNNFLAQVTPFVFYAGGGLLAVKYGSVDIGTLVAVIAAYKDLPGPIKELIDWDQRRQDVQIKYDQVVEQFQPPILLDPALQAIDADAGEPLTGELTLANVTLQDEGGARLLKGINVSIPVDGHIAVVGPPGAGKEQLCLVAAGLEVPSEGRVTIGGQDLASLPEAVTGRRLSYFPGDAYLFADSIHQNIVYGLLHKPRPREENDEERAAQAKADAEEARQSGSPYFDRHADWIDYEAAGVADEAELGQRILEIARLVELEADLFRFGLNGRIDPEARPLLVEGVLEIRKILGERLAEEGNGELVVQFDPETYNRHASLSENLLFGQPLDDAFSAENLVGQPTMRRVLKETGLDAELERIGLEIARTMVEIFADLPPGHPFFEQYSFIEADDLPDFRAMVQRADAAGGTPADDDDRRRLRRLPLGYIEARHRLGLIDESLAERIVEARKRFGEELGEEEREGVAFYDPEAFNAAANLLDNILFGRLVHGRAEAENLVHKAIVELLDEKGLREETVEVGLGYDAGLGGKRLSAAQRQKVAAARSLLKRPDLLILSEPFSVMDAPAQERLLRNILDWRKGQGVIWALHRPGLAEPFDQVLVMQDGHVVEQGGVEELNESGTIFHEMLHGSVMAAAKPTSDEDADDSGETTS